MSYKIYPLSHNVELYEEIDSTNENVENLLPFLRERVSFLEAIRKQQFDCSVACLSWCKISRYWFVEEGGFGQIEIQYPFHKDARYLPRLICHELCHYIMDSRKMNLIPGSKRYLSTYEEVIAETFALCSLLVLYRLCHLNYDKDYEGLISHYIEELKDEVRTHTDLLNREGLRAVPLYDDSFLPEYGNIRAVAFQLLPHFEAHPELWRMLPYVQDVHPFSDWNSFFGHLVNSVDEECRKALIDLYKDLFA